METPPLRAQLIQGDRAGEADPEFPPQPTLQQK